MFFDKTTGTSNYNINYDIVIISVAVKLISSRWKPLKTDTSLDYMCVPLKEKIFCKIHTLINLFISAIAQVEKA